jgi:hypothetical protein
VASRKSIVRDAVDHGPWRIPAGGLCGGAFGSDQYADVTFEDILAEDEEWGDDEGNDLLCVPPRQTAGLAPRTAMALSAV